MAEAKGPKGVRRPGAGAQGGRPSSHGGGRKVNRGRAADATPPEISAVERPIGRDTLMELQDELRAVPWPRAPLPTVSYNEVPLDRGAARAGPMPPEPLAEWPARPFNPRDTSAPEIEVSMTEVSLRALTLLDGSSHLDDEADDPFSPPAAPNDSAAAPSPDAAVAAPSPNAAVAAPSPDAAVAAPSPDATSVPGPLGTAVAPRSPAAPASAPRPRAASSALTAAKAAGAPAATKGAEAVRPGAARPAGAPRSHVHLPKVQINLPQEAASASAGRAASPPAPPPANLATGAFEALELRTFVIPPSALDLQAGDEQKLELVRQRFAGRLPCPVERVRRVDARLLEPGALMLLVWCPVD